MTITLEPHTLSSHVEISDTIHWFNILCLLLADLLLCYAIFNPQSQY